MPAPVPGPVPALIGLDALRDQLRQLHPRVAAITIAERTRSDHERQLGRVALDDEAVRAALDWTRTTRASSAADRNRVAVRAIHEMTWHKLVGPAPRRFRVRLYGHYSDQALISLTVQLRRAEGAVLPEPELALARPRSPKDVHCEMVERFVELVKSSVGPLFTMQEEAEAQLAVVLDDTRAYVASLKRMSDNLN